MNVDPIIQQYADGTISAMQAASLLGRDFVVADVIVMLGRAGLSPPQPTPEREAAELAHARRVLGLGSGRPI